MKIRTFMPLSLHVYFYRSDSLCYPKVQFQLEENVMTRTKKCRNISAEAEVQVEA